jgi:carnitine O-acetyltransferase
MLAAQRSFGVVRPISSVTSSILQINSIQPLSVRVQSQFVQRETSKILLQHRRSLHLTKINMFALTKFRGNAADKPKTFSQQDKLPKLPVPNLQDTFARYINSLEPILLQAEEMGQLPPGQSAQTELSKRQKWAAEALKPGSLVQKLQQRLLDVDRTSPNNWLDDRFWLQKAYHEWRVPLLVNSNWWLMFRANPNTPAAELEKPETRVERVGDLVPDADIATALGTNDWKQSEWGIRRAAWICHRLMQFKVRLETEDILPDASRAGPFCMHQYTRVFGVTRIPAIPHDFNIEAGFPNKNTHIIVLARNNFYKLQVQNKDGSLVSPSDIELALTSIVQDARRGDGKAIGVLTAVGRDDWTRSREHLLSISPKNRESINIIEDALFSLSLDSSVLPIAKQSAETAHPSTPPTVDSHARNSSGAGRGGLNRWFDKAISVIVEPNGRAGLMGEHSPCDALIPSIVIDFAAAVPAPKVDEKLEENLPYTAPSINSAAEPIFKKFEFDVDAKVEEDIQTAFTEARRISGESDIGELWFDEYGTEWIKKVAKQSPDAYIQQALQLAMFKVKGYQTPTYETASTRSFKHGRTDVIRSFSRESYEFVRAVREGKTEAEVYKLLSAATTAHNQQTRASSFGKGIDRHLTGLRLVYDATEDGSLTDDTGKRGKDFYAGSELLFSDPLLGDSQTWKLSTSGLSAGDLLAGTGFGSGFLDGVGINYLTGSQLLKFGIETKHPEPYGNGQLGQHPTNTFARAIVDALRYMRTLCESQSPAQSEGSKL